jgi:septal ring factor EnvC (AmiA/AmiB activator)
MHIHGHAMTPGTSATHSAAAAQKAAAAQRASETRRKLLKSAAELNGELDSQGVLMVGRWSEGGSSQRQGKQHSPPVTGNGAASGEPAAEPTAQPISFWA